MTCPRCGQADVAAAACPRCGVVFAKLQSARPRPAPRSNPPAPERGGVSPALFAVALALVAGVGWFGLGRRPEPPRRAAGTDPLPASAAPVVAPTAPITPQSLPKNALPQPQPELPISAPAGLSELDMRSANELIQKLGARRVGEADLKLANELCARYPKEDRLTDIQAGLLTMIASDYRSQRRYGEAEALVRRAIALRPMQVLPRGLLVAILIETNDFAGAERAAREAIPLAPRDAELQFNLAFALFRQDKNREALDVLRESLAIQETSQARSLYDRLLKTARDERGMAEQQIAHFHVRYDGAEHTDVGREILRQLERHYATLSRTFDHQPTAPVPVILFSQQDYYTAAGAPAWSGGAFDGMDGRIRIPIGGITASLTPEMDNTLIHELTHAFINDLSQGLAPREVHEGFAQYMEGHRIASRFSANDLKLIADGRAGGVAGFYAEALAFVEYLVATRGVGGINELLKAMAETGNVDSAFQKVHGRDYAGTQRAWRERLKQQYGS